jgi:hypothetical protein
MDTKVTLSFDEDVIVKAKQFADANNISLSRLTEYLFRKITTSNYKSLEDLPISDWVSVVSEGALEYKTKSQNRKALKQEYFDSKK